MSRSKLRPAAVSRPLRALDGALEIEGSQRVLHADLVAREARITLGQLPSDEIEAVRRIRVFGPAGPGAATGGRDGVAVGQYGAGVERVTTYDNSRVRPSGPGRYYRSASV
jgi:hypothetical protein